MPENKVGKALDLEESVTENSAEEATTTFRRACKRLLNPPIWHELAGAASASFKIVTENNVDPHRLACIHDYLAIDIPGPGSSAGDGYDWVQVENIAENAEPGADESLGISLKASSNPGKPQEGTAHFFNDSATSSFIIKRAGNTITASYHGRNETPNTKEPGLGDKIRNTLIAASAMAGIAEWQWKALIKGFLQKEIGG